MTAENLQSAKINISENFLLNVEVRGVYRTGTYYELIPTITDINNPDNFYSGFQCLPK